MRRTVCFTVLIVVGGLSMVMTSARQGGASPPLAALEQVRDNLYVIKGGNYDNSDTWNGGNMAVFVTEEGVVLVDTKLAGYGQAILDQLRSVTDKPVTTIINTHSHFDHAGSNTEFAETVQFVAHENTKANWMRPECDMVLNCDAFKGENAKFLPETTFSDTLSLFGGKDQIDLYYFGRGHTNGDIWVVFPAVRAMHAGDMFQRMDMPTLYRSHGGSAVEFADTLDKALATIENIDTIISGHGTTLFGWDDFEDLAGFYRHFVTHVKDGLQAGQRVDDVASTYAVPNRYARIEASAMRIKDNAQNIYDELSP